MQEALYQLLTIFIKVHHPKCIDLNHKVSYVHNKQLWISHLYQIYEFVCHEIQQSRNNANPNFSNFISELAITIFKTVNYLIIKLFIDFSICYYLFRYILIN